VTTNKSTKSRERAESGVKLTKDKKQNQQNEKILNKSKTNYYENNRQSMRDKS